MFNRPAYRPAAKPANDNREVRMVNVWTWQRVQPTQAEMRMTVDAERMAVSA